MPLHILLGDFAVFCLNSNPFEFFKYLSNFKTNSGKVSFPSLSLFFLNFGPAAAARSPSP